MTRTTTVAITTVVAITQADTAVTSGSILS
jgi:hypothetical protein